MQKLMQVVEDNMKRITDSRKSTVVAYGSRKSLVSERFTSFKTKINMKVNNEH